MILSDKLSFLFEDLNYLTLKLRELCSTNEDISILNIINKKIRKRITKNEENQENS